MEMDFELIFNINHDIYFRDYIMSTFFNNEYASLDIYSDLIYFLFFLVNLNFIKPSVVLLHEYVNSLYTSDLHIYFTTPIIEVIYNVHREYHIILAAICVLILYILAVELFYFRNIEYRFAVIDSFSLELIWSILPAIIILHFMMMSIALLYVSDEHPFFGFHVKVIGHQWYWEYEIIKCFSSIESIYTNMSESLIPASNVKYVLFNTSFNPLFNNLGSEFDDILNFNHLSASTLCSELVKGSTVKYEACRLLDTEGTLYVPYRIHVRLLITSMDVIHAFAIPSLGVKVDAIPGRLNDLHFFLTDNGAMTHYFGQCSELCGVGHPFMPIHMISI